MLADTPFTKNQHAEQRNIVIRQTFAALSGMDEMRQFRGADVALYRRNNRRAAWNQQI
jgi:hypothetical protein